MPSVSELAEICVPLRDQTAYKPRRLRVATIGAGYSGLIFAHKILHEQPDLQDFVEHTIYEANDGVGGTWKVNTYPGVQNDVPAHLYAFPFDPNPNWSKFYADGAEILDYMNHICDKWDLRRQIQFNTRVVDLTWQEDEGNWKVKVSHNGQERTDTVDILISAQGFLSRWKWPTIEGIHEFKGQKVHSASWDHSYDYTRKRIGIIGNGSSAIQILPQMAKLEGTEIVSFQRNPTWITPSLGETLAGGMKSDDQEDSGDEGQDDEQDEGKADAGAGGATFNPVYTKKDKERFADPEQHRLYRKKLQHGMNRGFHLFRKGSVQNEKSTQATIERMRKALNYNEDLCSKLIPDWTFGCRRLTPGEGFLEAFLLPNVSLTQSHIKRITQNGVETVDGKSYEFDVIICATGFDVSNIPHYPVTGRHGMTLAEKWKDEPESYLSLACPDFPNYFIFTGPNATVGHGTLVTSMNWSASWMIQWIRKIATEEIKSVAPKQSATDEFVRYGDEIHKTLAWTGSCVSWYKNHRKDGRVTATWPGSALLYKQMIERIRPEDFEIEYRSRNRFVFMGNGFTELEMQEDADLAFYIDK